MNLLKMLFLLYVGAGLVTLAAFAIDKMAAIRGKRRIPERTLHGLEWAGGWLGALIGLHLLRHKRRKSSYTSVLYKISIVHILLISALIWHL
jgi:uncharacterized membrane protein YsdA (DUF1294 family)